MVSDDSEMAMQPLCDEEEFGELVAGMVAMEAPRTFALVAERGVRVDAMVIGWGLQFDDSVDVSLIDGHTRLSLQTVASAVRLLSRHGTIRIVWLPVETPAA